MGNLIRNEHRAYTQKPDGGEIICKKCNKSVGFINSGMHQYIKFLFYCTCENLGKIELSKGEKPTLEYPRRKIYQKENVHICPSCERELFRVNEDRLFNYTFNAVCKCGIEYDMKYINKKLG